MEAASDAEEPASEEAKDVPVEPTVVDLSTVTVEDLPLLMKAVAALALVDMPEH